MPLINWLVGVPFTVIFLAVFVGMPMWLLLILLKEVRKL